jgi:hypothetical protein
MMLVAVNGATFGAVETCDHVSTARLAPARLELPLSSSG